MDRALVQKKLAPGQPGTKRYVEQYGDRLVCLRYRVDPTRGRRYTTVELIVDVRASDTALPSMPARSIPAGHQPVRIRVAYEEDALRRKVKAAGGEWDKQAKLWTLPYSRVVDLGLADRLAEPPNDGNA